MMKNLYYKRQQGFKITDNQIQAKSLTTNDTIKTKKTSEENFSTMHFINCQYPFKTL